MHDELVRTVTSVPVAILLSGSRPVPKRRSWRVALPALLVALALANHLGLWKTWASVAIAALAGALTSVVAPDQTAGGQRAAWLRGVWVVALAASATAVVALIVDSSATVEAIASAADRRSTVLVIAGGLVAIFPGGELIAYVLHPFAKRLGEIARRDEGSSGMENAGRIIGWLERALLYSLVLAGAPDAAALVVAGKSIARFPAFSEESFAEYYLIGSLMSLLVALGAGIAVRGMLGQTLLPSALG